jgi:hypothetical protein
MTMTIPRAGRRTSPATSNSIHSGTAAAQRLRSDFAAARVSFTWFGVRKTLSSEQRALAAEPFGAEGQYLSAAKKLLDNKHEAFQQVTGIRTQIISYWKGMSLPYPDPGVRLLRQQDVDRFNSRMSELKGQLSEAVTNLDQFFEQLKLAARDRLGRLFNPADYPSTLIGLFGVEYDFPSVEAPEYLARLNPHLYQQEQLRISQRFDEAVRLAEEAFTAEFSKLVSHLTERLTADPSGEKKVFRDSAINNLTEFFNRFRALNVRSSADLEHLVATAQQALQGANPQALRDSDALRQQITSELSTVQSHLDQMLVDQPRRRILRNVPGPNGAPT